jgi:N-acetylmuramoyl-L-alanine amidase
MTRSTAMVASLFAAAALGACGGPRETVEPARPDVDRVYKGLASPLPRVDATTLAGFRVLIDPGHGGSFRGTVGQDSLEEARVNLGVSLYLWGLLREAGADAHLTRSSDRDFLTAADSALAADLQVRVDAIDSLQPDVFISIHHNAQPQRDPKYNRVETYYTAGDPASLDLAFAIHRHLMRNLGIDVGEVRQGNYYVLRNAGIPAVLGESSYLTHPPVEQKLRLSEAQELEAEAYFLGIVDYCRRGIPRVLDLAPADSSRTAEVPVISCTFEDHGGDGVDPDGVSMRVNGEPVPARLFSDGRTARYALPWDAPNGDYDVSVSARNLGGNSSTVSHTHFQLQHPPAIAAITSDPPRIPRGGGVMRVRARVLDARGLPVADGTPVSLTGTLSLPVVEGVVSGGSVEFALVVPAAKVKDAKLTLTCGDRRFGAELPAGRDRSAAWRPVVVRDAQRGGVIADARVLDGDSLLSGPSASGVHPLPASGDGTIVAPGYRPLALSAAPSDTVTLEPWFDGALIGKRFVIDPQGGPPRRQDSI